jgi:carnitine O-acetyltransferase
LKAKEGSCPTHLIVMYGNRFYKLDIYHNDGLLTIGELYHQLNRIVKENNKPKGLGVGALTADQRDTWAEVRRNYLFFYQLS